MSATLSITMPMSIPAPKGKILCVDDEPNILRALSWLLQKEFTVVTTQSGAEGLKLVEEGDFDVVISDQRMPEMSGVEFLNEVRQRAPRTMRILLTGYSDLQAILRSVNEAEIFRYVTKPWNVTELPALVAQAAEIAQQQDKRPILAQVAMPAETPSLRAKILVLDDDEMMHSAVEMSAGDLSEIVHATNPVDAFHALENENIGVILSERKLGTMDMTHLLCVLKRRHPAIVSVVLTDDNDSHLIANLINRGQIYRFIQKPVKAGFLRLTLKSALAKNSELLNNPELAVRHTVNPITEAEEIQFRSSLTNDSARQDSKPIRSEANSVAVASLMGKFGGFIRKLFSR